MTAVENNVETKVEPKTEVKTDAKKEAPYSVKSVDKYYHISPKAGHSSEEVRDYIVGQARASGMSEEKITSAMAIYDKCIVPGTNDTHSFSKAAEKDLKANGGKLDRGNLAQAYSDYNDLTKELLAREGVSADKSITVATQGYGNSHKNNVIANENPTLSGGRTH